MIVPAPRSAQTDLPPLETADAPPRPEALSGVVEHAPYAHESGAVELPFPSSPMELLPQQSISPLASTAQTESTEPTLTETPVAPLRPDTGAGDVAEPTGPAQLTGAVVEPVPNSPWLFQPQQSIAPLDRTAQTESFPTEMAVAPLSPVTATGVVAQACGENPAGMHLCGPAQLPFPS